MSSVNLNYNARYFLQRAYDSGIQDPAELANLMGQASVESGGFRALEERLNYSPATFLKHFSKRTGITSYEEAEKFLERSSAEIANAIYGGEFGRKQLGNTEPTDGFTFRGRGMVQITGRTNYINAAIRTGHDVVNNPDLISTDLNVACDTSIAYWKENVVKRNPELRHDVAGATKLINSGRVAQSERIQAAAAWAQALTPERMEQLANGEISPNARQAYQTRIPLRTSEEGARRHWPASIPATSTAPQADVAAPGIDELLMRKIRAGVNVAQRNSGMTQPITAARMTAYLYGVARDHNLTGDDTFSIEFNKRENGDYAGRWLLLTRVGYTPLPDGPARQIRVSSEDAITQSAERTMRQVLEAELARQQDATALAAQQHAGVQHGGGRGRS